MYENEAHFWKQSLSVSHPQPDPGDHVQFPLDHICELQWKLSHDTSDISELWDEATDSVHDADEEYDSEDDDANADVPSDRDVVLAGFEFCAKEALKFLVEQEQLGPHHPAVRQLTAHLEERRRQLDSEQVLASYFPF